MVIGIKKERIKIAFAILSIAVFILFKLLNLDFRFGDGNAYVYMAQEILSGSIPYRDFDATYCFRDHNRRPGPRPADYFIFERIQKRSSQIISLYSRLSDLYYGDNIRIKTYTYIDLTLSTSDVVVHYARNGSTSPGRVEPFDYY